MSDAPFINILVAEDNDVSREMLTGILQSKGYKVFGAVDGDSAIKVIEEHTIHLALVDVKMAPKGGLDFMRYLVAQKIKLPVILVTADDSADLLVEASALGVAQLLQKPVQPDRLLQAVERVARRLGLNPAPLAVEEYDTLLGSEELMQKVLDMAADNAAKGKGGPYAAIVAGPEGRILGSGTNSFSSRVDPIAHAEVVAIRQAAEKLGSSSLESCTLYCAFYPTKIGQALIESVGLTKVYYGLTLQDTDRTPKETHPIAYEQICKEKALAMFKQSRT